MKKLISIFAALALVGSLAAQKKKPAAPAAPAKAAAPAVAAPAAPAVAAPAVPAPEAMAPKKGLGLSVEAYGGYTLAGGSSTGYGNSGSQTDGANSAIKYELSNSYAFSGGAVVAYEIVQNLGLTLGFDYRAFSTRQYSGPVNSSPWSGILRDLAYSGNETTIATSLNGAGCTNECQQRAYADFGKTGGAVTLFKSDYGQKTTWKNMVLTLGVRPSVNILGGRVYAGGGLAVVLPYETTTEVTFSSKAGLLATSMPDSGTQTDKWGLGLGGFGEVGYTYNITDNVYAGIGAKVIMATANNADKTRVLVANMPNGTTKTATITISESVTEAEKTLTAQDAAKTIYTAKQGVSSNGITDITAQVVVGVRF